MEATPATCCSRLLGGEGSVAASGRRRALSLSTACRKFRETADARPRARRAGSAVVLAASSSPSFDLSPPPIDYDGDDLQFGPSPSGAEDLPDTAIGSFADDNTALNAAYDGVAVIDLTHFGRIRVSGEDRVQFLHNQSTANFQSLSEGQGCDTVLVTPTARTIDIPHAWVMKNAIMLLVSPQPAKLSLICSPGPFVHILSDKVEINDITGKTCFFALMGPKSFQVMEALKLHDIIGKPYGTHHHYRVNDMPVTVGVGSLLSKEGFSLLMSPESAEPIWRTLLRHGAVPMGNSAWERLRILKGRPAPGKELTNDYNILEAGLWMTISLDKGCYKGQETVSRLITYDGVKQSLRGSAWRGQLSPAAPLLWTAKRSVGVLTSYAMGRDAGEHVGLGYIKRKAAASAGLQVTVGDVQGTVVDAPFLCYSLQT
ncbi:unnamed protein product [Spirodela intermedia]|uniref:GCVT N-terminal domain-containing protein n=1 Tax=Spirodela intermedia TaxID=51605 RepID=A0A7I8J4A7_SPIIN|nr:unnamed protein product [Spirodela intermedia]CAA6664900.1 unnamed protein product [Spirodela intermedia]